MVETFSSFTIIFFALVTLVILGIIFEKQLIALEDKFDEWFKGVKNNVRKQKEVKGSR